MSTNIKLEGGYTCILIPEPPRRGPGRDERRDLGRYVTPDILGFHDGRGVSPARLDAALRYVAENMPNRDQFVRDVRHHWNHWQALNATPLLNVVRLACDLQEPSQCRSVPKGEGVGIELEYLRLRSHDVGDQQRDITPLQLPGVHWGYDGSTHIITPEGGQLYQPQTNEVRIFQRAGRWERLTKLCSHLETQGCVAYPTAGLHVHLDCRDVGEMEAYQRYLRLRSAMRWMKRLAPEYRALSRYCRLVHRGNGMGSRYVAVNWTAYHEHETVEVRYHHSTLDPRKIVRWYELLRWVSRNPKVLPNLNSFLASPAPPLMKVWVLHRTVQLGTPKELEESKLLLADLLRKEERSETKLSAPAVARLLQVGPRVEQQRPATRRSNRRPPRNGWSQV